MLFHFKELTHSDLQRLGEARRGWRAGGPSISRHKLRFFATWP